MAEQTNLFAYDNQPFGCGGAESYFKNNTIAYLRCQNPHKKTQICDRAEMLDKNMQVIGHACCQVDFRKLRNVSANEAMNRITLTDAQKKNLSKDAQALVEAGYYTADLRLNSQSHFINFLVEKFEKDYAADAAEKLKADDRAKELTKIAQQAATNVSQK